MDNAYVLTDFASNGAAPRLVGRMEYDAGVVGRFQYARSYLESGAAFPLDPINLPLGDQIFELSSRPFIFGALLDAGPDDWGQRALAYCGKPAEGIPPLLLGSGTGVGSLLFSRSRDRAKPRPALPTLDDLSAMLEGAGDIERGDALPLHIAKLLEAGTSMGGARPKAVLEDGGRAWLAKFPSTRDVLDQPTIESATLTLAKLAGLDVPEHRIVPVAGRNVMLIERFDMPPSANGGFAHLHYVSMAALLTVGRRLRPDAVKREQSYMGLAGILRAHGADPSEMREIFRRMAFNVLIGHVDDHQRNHGFLLKSPAGHLQLAPVFDIAPSNGTAESVSVLRDVQAIGIGQADGALRTLDNLFSSVADFSLSREEAIAEFENVRKTVRTWESVFRHAGVSEKDCDRIRHRIEAPSLGRLSSGISVSLS